MDGGTGWFPSIFGTHVLEWWRMGGWTVQEKRQMEVWWLLIYGKKNQFSSERWRFVHHHHHHHHHHQHQQLETFRFLFQVPGGNTYFSLTYWYEHTYLRKGTFAQASCWRKLILLPKRVQKLLVKWWGYPPGNDHIAHQTGSSENHRLNCAIG